MLFDKILQKRCSVCDNTQPRLENQTYLKRRLLGQEDPAHDGPAGALRLLCFPCFVEDDGKNVHTKELYKNVQKRIKASCGRKHWGDTSWSSL